MRAERPGLKVVFASGYNQESAGRELILEAGQDFIQKPWQPTGSWKPSAGASIVEGHGA